MSWKRIGIWALLVDFTAFTAWVVYQHGYISFFAVLLGNAVGIQVFADLVIALLLCATWLVRDARERGVSPIPYLVVTLFAGSIGPLLYLAMRPETEAETATQRVAHA